MTWLYFISALAALLVFTHAANSAIKRRQARHELRERRIALREKYGGLIGRRLRQRLRQRRLKK